jgi:ubiquinone/menaquinone biosynthesis C-methylase UbiE
LYDGKVIPFNDDSFDVTYAAFMLHHTTNTRSLISECIRVTRQRLLILEDVYKNNFELFISKALDHANLLTSSDMNIPFNFRKENEWISLFRHPRLKLINTQKVRPVAFRPTRHRLFILEVQ